MRYAVQGLYDSQLGDNFILCNASGDGVSVASYTICGISPSIEVRESLPEMSEEYGSAEIDQRFRELLTSKLEREPGWDSTVLAEAVTDFESVSKTFTIGCQVSSEFLQVKWGFTPARSKTDETRYHVLVPGLPDNVRLDIKGGKVGLLSSELFDIFEPAVGNIVKLVKGQVKWTSARVKGILLVGELGQNSYLMACLRDAIDHSIEILRPANGGMAIVRGALMIGTSHEALKPLSQSTLAVHPQHSAVTPSIMATSITTPPIRTPSMTSSRIATQSYGYQAHVLFDPKIHDERKK